MSYHLHLVSDSTGETIESLTRACVVQFEDIEVNKHKWNLIRSPRLLQTVLNGIKESPGLVLYTFVDEDLRGTLERFCADNDIPCVAVLRPVLRSLCALFGKMPSHDPGRQHALDDDYFARINAMDYAMAQDDGHGQERLHDADVIVLGVSRTSKTPTCIYLARSGIRAANIPIIRGHGLPDLSVYKKALIIGLTKDAQSLIAIRRNRMSLLNENRETEYTQPECVRAELQEARHLFARLQCPTIDVSRKSVEETAAEIMTLLSKKREKEETGFLKRQPESSGKNALY